MLKKALGEEEKEEETGKDEIDEALEQLRREQEQEEEARKKRKHEEKTAREQKRQEEAAREQKRQADKEAAREQKRQEKAASEQKRQEEDDAQRMRQFDVSEANMSQLELEGPLAQHNFVYLAKNYSVFDKAALQRRLDSQYIEMPLEHYAPLRTDDLSMSLFETANFPDSTFLAVDPDTGPVTNIKHIDRKSVV